MEGKANYFSPIDHHVGKFILSLNHEKHENTRLAASLISRNLRDGHVCLNLREFAGRTLDYIEKPNQYFRCPELPAWLESLKKDENVGLPGEFKPLILDGYDRLYFHRYWQYEQDIVRFIRQRSVLDPESSTDIIDLQRKLRFYFPKTAEPEIDWSGIAAIAALLKKFLVITGSPGTGKTTTVAGILAFLIDCDNQAKRIALCAPTGKAAQRLEESILKVKTSGSWPEIVKNSIPNEAMTVHRLLGSIRFSPYFRCDENNPLPYDIIVVDESSMVDLPLMAKLMRALSNDSRLILLGDKDQLASVEAGAVLGSICFPVPLNSFSDLFEQRISEIYGKPASVTGKDQGVWDCIIELKKNFRFREDSGLSIVSRTIKNGNNEQFTSFLNAGSFSDIHFFNLHRTKKTNADMISVFADSYRDYLEAVASDLRSPEEIFILFEKFRILCALRSGFWGVERINRSLEKYYYEEGLISLNSPHYEGRPIMITQNDYSMNLFNGDVGIVLKDKKDNHKLKAYFRQEKEGMRKMTIARLPRHETVWAMTVHKSQGSEFDSIALILSDSDNPVLTRELVYTGITRARYSAQIWATADILMKSVNNQIIRHSGLTDAMKE